MRAGSRPVTHTRRKLRIFALVAVVTALAAACSSGTTADTTTSAAQPTGETTTAATETTAAAEASGELTIDALPKEVQQYYGSYETFAKLFPDPYQDWTPPAPPWKFCLNNSYLGNDWRQGDLAEYQRQVKLYQDAGLADGDLVVTDSDNQIALQLSQFNTLVNEGCDVIFSLPGSPTALCDAFTAAHDKGILVVTDESPTYCPNSINVSWNGYWAEYVGVKAVVDALGGKGNIVAVEGIAGVPAAVAEQAAVKDAMAEYPDATLLGSVAGNWTPSVTKTEMTKFLATHPQQVDGVIDAGAEAVAAEQALESAGRPLAKVNSIDAPASFLAYWKEHPEIGTVATNQSPAASAYETFLVAARKLAGQNMVVNTVFYPVPQITSENFDQWYKPSMTVESSGIPTPPDGRAAPDEYFDVFFSGGQEMQLAPEPPTPTE